jgi:uncharacterized membrane protein YcaP (DUF421 family)
MLNFWLVIAIVMTLFITYKSFTEGVEKWRGYYVFVVLAFLMFFVRKWMMKRMEKHLKYLQDKNNQ